MQRRKNMIYKHGSQVMEHTDNLFHAQIAPITSLVQWKLDAEQRKKWEPSRSKKERNTFTC